MLLYARFVLGLPLATRGKKGWHLIVNRHFLMWHPLPNHLTSCRESYTISMNLQTTTHHLLPISCYHHLFCCTTIEIGPYRAHFFTLAGDEPGGADRGHFQISGRGQGDHSSNARCCSISPATAKFHTSLRRKAT